MRLHSAMDFAVVRYRREVKLVVEDPEDVDGEEQLAPRTSRFAEPDDPPLSAELSEEPLPLVSIDPEMHDSAVLIDPMSEQAVSEAQEPGCGDGGHEEVAPPPPPLKFFSSPPVVLLDNDELVVLPTAPTWSCMAPLVPFCA